MTYRKNKALIQAAACATALTVGLLAGNAFATELSPGSGPTATPGLASFSGLTSIADQTVPYSGLDAFNNVKFSGTVESTVYQESDGDLDFAYHVVSLGGPDSVSMDSVNSYTGFTTDVDYVAGTGGVTYATANRLSFGGGDTVSFDYSELANSITPGATADWILIRTNATRFDDLGTTNLLDGGGATVQSFEPALPEPMSMGLLAIGGAGLLSRRPRKTLA